MAWIRHRLGALLEARTPPPDDAPRAWTDPAVTEIARRYGLSPLETEILVIALAPDVDSRFGRVYAQVSERAGDPRATIGLAAGLLTDHDPAPLLRALVSGPLTRCGLVEIVGDGPLTFRTLAPHGSVVARVLDVPYDPPFAIARRHPDALTDLVLAGETHTAAEQLVARLRDPAVAPPIVVVRGRPGRGRDALARAICGAAGRDALQLAATNDAPVPAIVRETVWHDAIPVLGEGTSAPRIRDLAVALPVPLIAIGDDVRVDALASVRPVLELEVLELNTDERRRLWRDRIPAVRRAADLDLDAIAMRYPFGPGRIAACAELVLARGDDVVTAGQVDAACRRMPTTGLGALATVLPCPYEPDEIVLPPSTRRELDLAAAWVRNRAELRPHVASRGRPPGLVCLFHGPPGTGKTMAAQVIARRLEIDVLRIDLSQVVNKYVGETEKNLERLFAAAETGCYILFFDEADAIFARRTEVQDAHDRYANLETGYLLQRLEAHDGIAILASNLRANLDPAFLRRMQIVAEFPMPSAGDRLAIWERLVPAERDGDVDLQFVAERFAFSGGDIRNAAHAAIVLAKDERAPISMRHLVVAIWRELQKAGRLLQPDEFGPWTPLVIEIASSARPLNVPAA